MVKIHRKVAEIFNLLEFYRASITSYALFFEITTVTKLGQAKRYSTLDHLNAHLKSIRPYSRYFQRKFDNVEQAKMINEIVIDIIEFT